MIQAKPTPSRLAQPSAHTVTVKIHVTKEQLAKGNIILVIDLAKTNTDHPDNPPAVNTVTAKVTEEFDNYSAHYQRKDRRMVKAAATHFKAYVQQTAALQPSHSFPDTVRGYHAHLYNTLNGNTPANYFKKFREFLDIMLAKGIVKENTARAIPLTYYDYRQKTTLTLSEIHRLEHTPCRSDSLKRAFLFACCSGLRWCDINALRWDDIDIPNLTMTVRQQKVREHSRAAVLHTYLNASSLRFLNPSPTPPPPSSPSPRPSRLSRPSRPSRFSGLSVYSGSSGSSSISGLSSPSGSSGPSGLSGSSGPSGLSSPSVKRSLTIFPLPSYSVSYRILQTWIRDAGITKHVSFHCARHTFISRLVAAGVDLKTVADLAGHSTTRHTERYVHKDERHLRDSISRIEI